MRLIDDLRKDGIDLMYVVLLPVKLLLVLLQIIALRDDLLAPVHLRECADEVLNIEVAAPKLLDLVSKHIHEVECRVQPELLPFRQKCVSEEVVH